MTGLARKQLNDVQSAIDSLTRLRDQGSSGGDAWSVTGRRVTFNDNGQLFTIAELGNWGAIADLLLIAVLQRTVDVQLALLAEAENYITDWVRAHPNERGAEPSAVYRHELNLAEAINRSVTA